MNADDVRQLLLASFPDAVINVTGEDANFSVDVVSPDFENVSRLNRQKKILACVKDQITAGDIHAFVIQAFTQDEWDRNANKLNVL
ncbi:MAG: BolA/IbaG family iron-sulfur metabolism protein [Gammaproteobacteria bacterium]|jgi:acid stress-induced BolA-like protein IbaG/YrbA